MKRYNDLSLLYLVSDCRKRLVPSRNMYLQTRQNIGKRSLQKERKKKRKKEKRKKRCLCRASKLSKKRRKREERDRKRGSGRAFRCPCALSVAGKRAIGSRSDFLLVSLFPAQRFPASDTAGLLILIIDRGIIKVAPARGRFQLRISVPPGTIGLVREKRRGRTEKERKKEKKRREEKKKKKEKRRRERERGWTIRRTLPFPSFPFFSRLLLACPSFLYPAGRQTILDDMRGFF